MAYKLAKERPKYQQYQKFIDNAHVKISKALQDKEKYKDDPERCKKFDDDIARYNRTIAEFERRQCSDFLTAEDYEISPTVNLDMVNFHIDHLFPPDNARKNGLVSMLMKDEICCDRKIVTQTCFKRKIPHILSFDMNTYLSPATFRYSTKAGERNVPFGEKPKIKENDIQYIGSVKENIVSTGAIIIDLDYYDTVYGGILAEDLYDTILQDGAFERFGEPSYCVVTSEAHGMQMIYLLDKPYQTYLQDYKIRQYETVVKEMIQHFKQYGADSACSDISHLFRMPCSYNTKKCCYSFILHWEKLKDEEYEVVRYSFHDLRERSQGATAVHTEDAESGGREIPAPGKKAAGVHAEAPHKKTRERTPTPGKKSVVLSDGALDAIRKSLVHTAEERCRDLIKLAEMRGAATKGKRNEILFIYASQISIVERTQTAIYNRLVTLNQLFSEPKSEKELQSLAERFTKKHYLYTDKKILDELCITADEIRCLQVIGHSKDRAAYMSEYVNVRAKKKRRNADGKLISTCKREDRDNKIIDLRNRGYTNQQIMKELGISKSTVQRAYREYRKAVS